MMIWCDCFIQYVEQYWYWSLLSSQNFLSSIISVTDGPYSSILVAYTFTFLQFIFLGLKIGYTFKLVNHLTLTEKLNNFIQY